MGDLSAGRLVRLADIEIKDDYGWFLVWREPLRGAQPILMRLQRGSSMRQRNRQAFTNIKRPYGKSE
jgi:hypothetical protein